MPRLEGWWSTDPDRRFEMLPISDPQPSADAWSLSNPPIFAMSPVRTSLQIFDEVGMSALRDRSLRLTAYLRGLLENCPATERSDIVTPAQDDRHGAQLSIRVPVDPVDLTERLSANWGVVGDDRRPNVVRLAPAPLYTSFHDCWRAVDAMSWELAEAGLA